MTDDDLLSPEAARAIAALGGVEVDEETSRRIARSVTVVTRSAANFRDEIAFDDARGDFERLRRAAFA